VYRLIHWYRRKFVLKHCKLEGKGKKNQGNQNKNHKKSLLMELNTNKEDFANAGKHMFKNN
jgi:hypothetical protein